jgi:type VI secretion system protein ImpC
MTTQTQTLLDEVMNVSKLESSTDGYDLAKVGVQSLLSNLLQEDESDLVVKVDKKLVDEMIAELDARLSEQLDAILHNEDFQKVENKWRGLQFLVNRTDFDENIKVELLDASLDELKEDFEDAPKLSQSALYDIAYTQEYGQFGGEPVGVVLGDFEFSYGASDVEFLKSMADLSSVTHAPFISAASPSMFGLKDYNELGSLSELESVFDGPQYLPWHGLREHDTARNLGIVMPRYMGRVLYGMNKPVKAFDYQEVVEDKEQYLWSSAIYPYGTRLTESFASYRWCPNIIGPQSGGALLNMPVNSVERDGTLTLDGPIESVISDRKEMELSDLGFIALSLRKGSDNAAFFSSNSVLRPKVFGSDPEEKAMELNYRLGTQLPYLFIVNRLAHYIKVLQRENLGSWKSRVDLESELNKWIRQYIADQENPSPATRSQRPLRKAAITVTSVEGESGWYEVGLEVTPHFKFMGANFTLSLTGVLERA